MRILRGAYRLIEDLTGHLLYLSAMEDNAVILSAAWLC